MFQNILSATIIGVLYFRIAYVFADEYKYRKTGLSIFLVLINILILFAGILILDKPYMIIVTVLILMMNVLVLSPESIFNSVTRTFTVVITLAVIDTLFGLLLILFGFEVVEIRNSFVISISMAIVELILVRSIFKMFYRKRVKKAVSLAGLTNKRKFSIAMFVMSTVLILIFNTYLFTSNDYLINNENLITILLLYFLYLFVILKFISINRSLSDKTEEYEQLRFYTDLVEGLVEESVNFKHDYRNVLASFFGYIESKDYEGLNKYFVQLMEVSDQLSSKNEGSLMGICDSGIKGLLSVKFNQIRSESIELEVEIHENIKFSIGTLDLSRILGVLLDNAKESAVRAKNKNVKIGILNEEGQVSVVIANTFDEAPKLAEIFNRGKSSKGDNRGYGLSNVIELLNTKYSFVSLNTYIKDDFFVQEIIF